MVLFPPCKIIKLHSIYIFLLCAAVPSFWPSTRPGCHSSSSQIHQDFLWELWRAARKEANLTFANISPFLLYLVPFSPVFLCRRNNSVLYSLNEFPDSGKKISNLGIPNPRNRQLLRDLHLFSSIISPSGLNKALIIFFFTLKTLSHCYCRDNEFAKSHQKLLKPRRT